MASFENQVVADHRESKQLPQRPANPKIFFHNHSPDSSLLCCRRKKFSALLQIQVKYSVHELLFRDLLNDWLHPGGQLWSQCREFSLCRTVQHTAQSLD